MRICFFSAPFGQLKKKGVSGCQKRVADVRAACATEKQQLQAQVATACDGLQVRLSDAFVRSGE